jgi:hypothetical protein
MKPDWSTAPKLAKYLAMDKDDEWFWFSRKPILWCWDSDQDEWKPNGGSQKAMVAGSRWRDTLEERPVEAEGK